MKEELGKVIGVIITVPAIIGFFVAIPFVFIWGFFGVGTIWDSAAKWSCEKSGGNYEWIDGEYSDWKACITPNPPTL